MFVNVRPSIIISSESMLPHIANRRFAHRLEPGFPLRPPGFGQNTAIATTAIRFCTAHRRKRYQRPYKAGGSPSRPERVRIRSNGDLVNIMLTTPYFHGNL